MVRRPPIRKSRKYPEDRLSQSNGTSHSLVYRSWVSGGARVERCSGCLDQDFCLKGPLEQVRIEIEMILTLFRNWTPIHGISEVETETSPRQLEFKRGTSHFQHFFH